jgi:Protein of unknown function (DUF3108)
MHNPPSLMLAAAIALAQGASPAPPPQQQPAAGSISLSYALTIFAIPLGHLEYTARFETARYKAQMHFHTGGLAAVLWKAQIDGAAEGRATPDALLPDSYTTQSTSRSGAHRSVHVDYSGKGPPVTTVDPPDDPSVHPVTNAQKQGTVDPVTAMSSVIAGFSTSAREPCGKTMAVFDGRRRYDIVFNLMQHEQDARGAGTQPRVCKAEYRHIAGASQDVVNVSEVPAIYATFAEVSIGTRHYTFARTIWSSFLWGAVNAKLTEAKIDGRALPLESQQPHT